MEPARRPRPGRRQRARAERALTEALATSRKSDLMHAARRGEAFDVQSGLPMSELRRQRASTLVELAQAYVAMKWPEQAANCRSGWRLIGSSESGRAVDAAARPDPGLRPQSFHSWRLRL